MGMLSIGGQFMEQCELNWKVIAAQIYTAV